MTREEKLRCYARAPRASAGRLTRFVGGDFIEMWVGKLNGNFVRMTSDPRLGFPTRVEAVESARQFRASCRADLEGGRNAT